MTDNDSIAYARRGAICLLLHVISGRVYGQKLRIVLADGVVARAYGSHAAVDV